MRNRLNKEQKTKIIKFLRSHPRVYVGNEAACGRFLDGVHWMVRTGAQWRELPQRYGHWNSVYTRFARWCEQEIWLALFTHFAQDRDMEWVMLDSSVIRAHPCAAGALKKTGGKPPRR